MKLTLVQTSIEVGGPLHELALNLTLTNAEIAKTSGDGLTIYDDTLASVENKIQIDQATLFLILANGGEVEEYIMYLRTVDAIATTNVPVGLPRRTTRLGTVKNFDQWFDCNMEAWTQDPGTGVLFSTNVFASNAPEEYLKGSEIKTIYDLDPGTQSVLNAAEKDALIGGGGWNVLPPTC